MKNMSYDSVLHLAVNRVADARFRDFANNVDYEWYYAEERLYLLRKKESGIMHLVKAGSPDEALKKLLERG